MFGINTMRGNYSGIFIFFDLIIFIIPSGIILNLFPIDYSLVAFKVQQATVFWFSFLIIVSMMLFYFTLFVISSLSKKYFYLKIYNEDANKYNIKFFTQLCCILCLCGIIFCWIVFGIGHSFFLAIKNDVSIGVLRGEI